MKIIHNVDRKDSTSTAANKERYKGRYFIFYRVLKPTVPLEPTVSPTILKYITIPQEQKKNK